MKGFFAESEYIVKSPTFHAPRCESCLLYTKCNSPKMPIEGEGKKEILLIGSSPGLTEDEDGHLFVGETGQFIERMLGRLGIDMHEDCWMTHALICRSKEQPTNKQIDFCRPNLNNAIEELTPKVIIPFGIAAIRSVMGRLWKENIGEEGIWLGWTIPSQELNSWVCPNWNPRSIISNKKKQLIPLHTRLFENNLERAVRKKRKPWEVVPDYLSQIECILDPKKAAHILRKMVQKGGTVCFDYETDRLKPDSKDAKIVCCSVCWNGKKTIAYPWHGEAIEATSELLRSPLPKWGQNIKFEERWTRAILGHRVRNWQWDAMLGMHWLDNRRKITGAKFQCMVFLGQGEYNKKAEPFLQAKGGNAQNNIHKMAIKDVLQYCGMDSLTEYLVGEIQQRKGRYNEQN